MNSAATQTAPTTDTLRLAATNVVRSAEFMGGRTRVEQIATFGHRGILDMGPFGNADLHDVLCAIQDAAKSIAAGY